MSRIEKKRLLETTILADQQTDDQNYKLPSYKEDVFIIEKIIAVFVASTSKVK